MAYGEIIKNVVWYITVCKITETEKMFMYKYKFVEHCQTNKLYYVFRSVSLMMYYCCK